jgi:hypothetical protein
MKIYIGGVTYRAEEVGFSQSMRLLQRELDKRRIEFVEGTAVGDALVSRGRSIVASAFLRSDCDILLSVDSDIWFRPEDAISMCEKVDDILAALYMTRSLNTQPALMLPNHPVTFHPDAEPVVVPFASTGFMAVHRKVFESLSAELPLCHKGWSDRGADTSFYPFYMPYTIPWEGDGHMYLSEDWAFCQRAKDAGFKVMLDPSIRLGHMGTTMYTLEDLIRPEKPKAQPMTLVRRDDGTLEIS